MLNVRTLNHKPQTRVPHGFQLFFNIDLTKPLWGFDRDFVGFNWML